MNIIADYLLHSGSPLLAAILISVSLTFALDWLLLQAKVFESRRSWMSAGSLVKCPATYLPRDIHSETGRERCQRRRDPMQL